MSEQDERWTGQCWKYRTTQVRGSHEGDDRVVREHLDKRAKEGWELVSANAVQMLFVGIRMS